MISCCTLCVHFPDGLSSLLADLVRAVLHSQLICVRSRTAVAPLHPFIHITQIRVEFVTSAVLCSVSSRSELCACLEGDDSLACAHFWRRMLLLLFFSFNPLFVFCFFLSVCHVAVLLPLLLSFLLCSRCSGLSDPAQKRDHRPGDDISEIMSCFTRTPPPSLAPSLPPSPRRKGTTKVFYKCNPITCHSPSSRGKVSLFTQQ